MSVSSITGTDRFAERCRWAVGQRIRTLREARGKTMKEIGLRSGVTQGLLSQYELGIKSVSLSAAVLLARALDVKPSEILAPLDGVL